MHFSTESILYLHKYFAIKTFHYLNIKVNPELAATEPLGAVAVQTDHVLPGHVGREGELPLAAVNLE